MRDDPRVTATRPTRPRSPWATDEHELFRTTARAWIEREILPLAAILLVMVLHWPQTLALFGAGTQHADFSLGPKQIPRWGEIIPPATAFIALALLPYLEELLRGLREKKQYRSSAGQPGRKINVVKRA